MIQCKVNIALFLGQALETHVDKAKSDMYCATSKMYRVVTRGKEIDIGLSYEQM